MEIFFFFNDVKNVNCLLREGGDLLKPLFCGDCLTI